MAIPSAIKPKYDEIAPLITSLCNEKLNEEFNDICLRLLEKLCRKRPSPLTSGRARTWAAGIAYAVCQINFIFDKSQRFHLTAAELAEPFGLSASTAGNKAAEIRKYVKMNLMTPEWLTKELTDENPLTWMVQFNGYIVDIRTLPIELQRDAYAKGIIPYVPEDNEAEEQKSDEPTREEPKLAEAQRGEPAPEVKPGQAFI